MSGIFYGDAMNLVDFLHFRTELVFLLGFCFYLILNKHIENLLDQAVNTWGILVSSAALVTLAFIVASNITGSFLPKLVSEVLIPEEWILIGSGIIIAEYFSVSIMYMAILFYLMAKQATLLSADPALSSLNFSIAILAIMHRGSLLNSENSHKLIKFGFFSFLISNSFYALNNFENFYLYTLSVIPEQITASPALSLVLLMSSISFTVLAIFGLGGRAISVIIALPSLLVTSFNYPQDSFLLPIVCGCLLGVLLSEKYTDGLANKTASSRILKKRFIN